MSNGDFEGVPPPGHGGNLRVFLPTRAMGTLRVFLPPGHGGNFEGVPPHQSNGDFEGVPPPGHGEARCGRAREEGGTPVPRGCAWLERRPSGGHLSGLGRLLPNTPNRRGKPCVQNARQSDKKNNPWSRWRAQRGTTLPRTTSSGHPRVVETQGGECVRWSPR